MTFGGILRNHQRLFWWLHLGGWAFWGVFVKYLYTTEVLNENIPGYLLYVAIITLIGAAITLVLRYGYRWSLARPFWVQVLTFLLGTSAGAWVWLRCRSYMFRGFIQDEKEVSAWMEKLGPAAEIYENVAYSSTFISAWTVIAAWSVLYFGIKYHRVFQEVNERALRSAAMAHEAQLKMLRYQLNPHFLFNTLNAISTLILERDTELANRMVTELSRFLRFSLDNDPLQKITLAEELEAINLYLGIEKVRFEDRLRLEQDIEASARQSLIPSLLLQPLVENAIKYGIARSETGGTLRIAARVFGGDLLVELRDDGPGCALEDGAIPGVEGVGLSNTRDRLETLYGDRHTLRLSRTEPHGLTINIRIPHEV